MEAQHPADGFTRVEAGEILKKLIRGMEEEDIGISLLTTFYQVAGELQFFQESDRLRVQRILQILAEDSTRHKQILSSVIEEIGRVSRAKRVP